MFCTKCGAQLKDGAKFCKYCGSRVENAGSGPVPGPQPSEQDPGRMRPRSDPGSGGGPVNPGNNTQGYARKPEGGNNAYREPIGGHDPYRKPDSGYDSYREPEEEEEESRGFPRVLAAVIAVIVAAAAVIAVLFLTGAMDDIFEEGFSLGSSSAGGDDGDAEESGEAAADGAASGELSGNAVYYNPFDAVEITFEGMGPDGTAKITVTAQEGDTIAPSLQYSLDRNDGLSNGDIVTVTVANDAEAFLESDGVVLSPTAQEYTVEGLQEYLISMEQVSEESMEQVHERVEEEFAEHVANDWITHTWSVLGMDYIGSYLLTAEEDEGHNVLYLVYQVNAECFEELADGFRDERYTYYYYVECEDVTWDVEGNLPVEEMEFVRGTHSYNLYKTYNVFGYETLEEMEEELVTAAVSDGYTCENLVEDQEFEYETVKLEEAFAVPEDAVEYNGHYYRIYGVLDMTWEQAKEQCELRGGHLATITSQAEMDAIAVDVFEDDGADYWVGGYYEDGQWLWLTGETMEDYGWSSGFPDASDSAAYAYLGTSSWRWRNFSLEGTHDDNYTVGYICEWDSDEPVRAAE